MSAELSLPKICAKCSTSFMWTDSLVSGFSLRRNLELLTDSAKICCAADRLFASRPVKIRLLRYYVPGNLYYKPRTPMPSSERRARNRIVRTQFGSNLSVDWQKQRVGSVHQLQQATGRMAVMVALIVCDKKFLRLMQPRGRDEPAAHSTSPCISIVTAQIKHLDRQLENY